VGVVAFLTLCCVVGRLVFEILRERNGFVFMSKIQSSRDDTRRPVRKVSSHFEYFDKREPGLDVFGSQSEDTLLRIREESPSREASQSAAQIIYYRAEVRRN
jgi:hypothetical protein